MLYSLLDPTDRVPDRAQYLHFLSRRCQCHARYAGSSRTINSPPARIPPPLVGLWISWNLFHSTTSRQNSSSPLDFTSTSNAMSHSLIIRQVAMGAPIMAWWNKLHMHYSTATICGLKHSVRVDWDYLQIISMKWNSQPSRRRDDSKPFRTIATQQLSGIDIYVARNTHYPGISYGSTLEMWHWRLYHSCPHPPE